MNTKKDHVDILKFDPARLVRDDRVHSSIFTDQAIFQLEMDRIFKKTWLFVLHESEIPESGNFKTLDLAQEPVIAVRDKEGRINVLLNRCRHRGATVCEKKHGQTSRFQCPYHGWIYGTDGQLLSKVEAAEDVPIADLGLAALPRVASYRGFIFTSFAEEGPTLDEFLGSASDFIDILIDYAPNGKLQVRPGIVHKYLLRGNWKQVGMDGYHVHFVHTSVVDIFSKRKNTSGSAVGALQFEDPWSDNASSKARGFPFGHAALDLRELRMGHSQNFIEEIRATPGGTEYVKQMIVEHGEAKAIDLIALHGDPHLGIYPNLQLIHDHLRVIKPISAGETEVWMYPILLEDASSEFNTHRLRHHEDFYGPASFGSPDDVEVFERTQKGLSADVNPWIMINRGAKDEKLDTDGSSFGCISSEVTQRAQFREWLRLMKN